MKCHPGSGLWLLGFVLLGALSNNSARCQDAASPSWSPKAAANYLDERTEWWLKWRGAARAGDGLRLVPHLLAAGAGPFGFGRATR